MRHSWSFALVINPKNRHRQYYLVCKQAGPFVVITPKVEKHANRKIQLAALFLHDQFVVCVLRV